MTELQRQLHHLISFYAVPGTDVDKAVREIEDAFTKEGYCPIKQVTDRYLEAGGDQNYYVMSQEWFDSQGYMPRQEFYDRFKKDLQHTARWKDIEDQYPRTMMDVTFTVGEVMEVAKRAAGLAPEGEEK